MNYHVIKRLFDIVFALILIALSLPLMILTAIYCYIVIDRRVLFIQRRPGRFEIPFHVYKFKTMTDKRDANGELLPDVKRLTRYGKLLRATSLDELPQLFNVFKGEMSFVGPRPLLMEYLSLYNKEQSRRHNVKPGITGWAQINGRNAINWSKKFELDIWYIEHQNFLVDLIILFKTVQKVVMSDNISDGHMPTAEKFLGND